MNSLRQRFSRWDQDNLLGKVLRSSAHLFSTNTISLGLSVLQSILAARLLGPSGFGLVAIVMGYASTVNGFFSFRMSELVVKYGGEYLEKRENHRAAALMKSAMLGEGLVSLLAFSFVAATAGLASQYIGKTPGSSWMFIAYALGLLANFNTETSTGILQVTDRIKLQGTINLIQSLVTFAMIAAAAIFHGSLLHVLLAYLAGKVIAGLGLFIAGQIQLRRALGRGWQREHLSSLPAMLDKFRFAFSSNLSATLILIFRESEVLWVGFFLNNEAAGYFKAAYAIILLLALPVHPLILTTYPELNRLIVQGAWPRLRDFLRKITLVAFGYNFILGLGLVLFGRWILWLYGEQYVSAYPALMALLVGMVFNFTLFWNRPLLLSFNMPTYPLLATLIAGLLKMAMAFPLVPRFGYVMEAALLSFYYLFSVGLMVLLGMREIRRRESSVA